MMRSSIECCRSLGLTGCFGAFDTVMPWAPAKKSKDHLVACRHSPDAVSYCMVVFYMGQCIMPISLLLTLDYAMCHVQTPRRHHSNTTRGSVHHKSGSKCRTRYRNIHPQVEVRLQHGQMIHCLSNGFIVLRVCILVQAAWCVLILLPIALPTKNHHLLSLRP